MRDFDYAATDTDGSGHSWLLAVNDDGDLIKTSAVVGTWSLTDVTDTLLGSRELGTDSDGNLVIGDGVTQGGKWVSSEMSVFYTTAGSPGYDTAYETIELARWPVSADRLAAGTHLILEWDGFYTGYQSGANAWVDGYMELDIENNTGGTPGSTIAWTLLGFGKFAGTDITGQVDAVSIRGKQFGDLVTHSGTVLRPRGGGSEFYHKGFAEFGDDSAQYYYGNAAIPNSSIRIESANSCDLVMYCSFADTLALINIIGTAKLTIIDP